jgi:hypothetical protein
MDIVFYVWLGALVLNVLVLINWHVEGGLGACVEHWPKYLLTWVCLFTGAILGEVFFDVLSLMRLS